ncbi:copper homeostasis protein cutc [Stagonosporopsis vannaccii]|nr:copper homeostasis protein cutc [Stagonosporopsis vannaccii]
MPTPARLEAAVFSTPSALLAARSGAHRLELCASYSLGGVTPSLTTLQTIATQLALSNPPISIPINVMIRPRGGSFVYTTAEFAEMKSSIASFAATGLVAGFVFGVLTHDHRVDEVSNSELVSAAGDLPCTFHRAIDLVPDLADGVESVMRCGFTSVLTSGGKSGAWEGREAIRGLQERCGGSVSVIAGGGVRSANAGMLVEETQVGWVHSAAIMGTEEEVDGEEVQKLVAVLGRVR